MRHTIDKKLGHTWVCQVGMLFHGFTFIYISDVWDLKQQMIGTIDFSGLRVWPKESQRYEPILQP